MMIKQLTEPRLLLNTGSFRSRQCLRRGEIVLQLNPKRPLCVIVLTDSLQLHYINL